MAAKKAPNVTYSSVKYHTSFLPLFLLRSVQEPLVMAAFAVPCVLQVRELTTVRIVTQPW